MRPKSEEIFEDLQLKVRGKKQKLFLPILSTTNLLFFLCLAALSLSQPGSTRHYMKYNAALVLTQKSAINQKAVLGNGGT